MSEGKAEPRKRERKLGGECRKVEKTEKFSGLGDGVDSEAGGEGAVRMRAVA